MQIYIHCLELFDENEEKKKFLKKIEAYLERAENMKKRLQRVTEELLVGRPIDKMEWNDWPQVCCYLRIS